MKFTRVDENTVTCVLSGEELASYDIKLDDFLEKNEKVRHFVDLIIGKAMDEVGYSSDGTAMQLQLQPLPDEGLAITFIKGEMSLQEMSKILTEKIGEDGAKTIFDIAKKALKKTGESLLDKIHAKNEVNPNEQIGAAVPIEVASTTYICQFENIKTIGSFCKTLQNDSKLKASVIVDKADDVTYFVLQKGDSTMSEYMVACRMLNEYASFESGNNSRLAYLVENNEYFIKDDAIQILKEIY